MVLSVRSHNEFLPHGWTVQGTQGVALVVTGPSGAGKSSVIDELLRRDPDLAFSVSATTRAPRPGEADGRDYYFVDSGKFAEMFEAGEFLEWATYQGHSYGTPRTEVEGRLAQGQDVLLNVEVQGALAIAGLGLPFPLVLAFLVPPTREELVRRVRGRGTETQASLDARMAIAEQEILQIPKFHYLVVNDDLEQAADRVQAVFAAERCRIIPCSA